MHVILVMVRTVVVDDQDEVLDVQASGTHAGGEVEDVTLESCHTSRRHVYLTVMLHSEHLEPRDGHHFAKILGFVTFGFVLHSQRPFNTYSTDCIVCLDFRVH